MNTEAMPAPTTYLSEQDLAAIIRHQIDLHVTALTEQRAIDLLREHGYTVKPPTGRWETPGQFCVRLGIHPQTFVRLRAHPRCPKFAAEYGPSGRMLLLQANEELEEFIRSKTSRHP